MFLLNKITPSGEGCYLESSSKINTSEKGKKNLAKDWAK